MRILVASDLHSLPTAYTDFVDTLRSYDAGVLAGDNLDEYLPDQALVEMLGLDPDVFLDELPAPDESAEDMVQRWEQSEQVAYLRQGLLIKERELRDILNTAGKPILVVPGNHDRTPWETDRNVINIHLKATAVFGQKFVGYGCITPDIDSDKQMALLDRVKDLIDERTILVTHIPPSNVLDHDGLGENGFGSRILAGVIAERRPLFHFFGHAHSAFGVQGRSINAAYPLTDAFFGVDTISKEIWIEGGEAAEKRKRRLRAT